MARKLKSPRDIVKHLKKNFPNIKIRGDYPVFRNFFSKRRAWRVDYTLGDKPYTLDYIPLNSSGEAVLEIFGPSDSEARLAMDCVAGGFKAVSIKLDGLPEPLISTLHTVDGETTDRGTKIPIIGDMARCRYAIGMGEEKRERYRKMLIKNAKKRGERILH